ncbi:MAG: terpene cyclase/mutase family protein [Planctomycetes bacterium]|nr:terpene cyclase/mutase family protein [Planctomycetota bacterium]
MKAKYAASLVAVLLCVGTAQADVNNPGPLESYKEKIDQSIDRGLAFLATQQFDAAKSKPHNAPLVGNLSDGVVGNTGITSLSVMAFLAKGHTPGQGPYGEVINRGIDYILDQQDQAGLLDCKFPGGKTNGVMYAHSIATLMLAEVTGMVDPARQRRIDVALPKALTVILKAQAVPKDPNNTGGWRYMPNSNDSDLSLTGWAIMALRAGKLNGASVPKESIDLAVAYILRCRHPQDGGFAYTPGGGPNQGLTGAGILCLELCGRHGHEVIKPASESLMRTQNKGYGANMTFFYNTYYSSQAAFQLGPEFWNKWAPQMYENLLAGQAQQGDGGWPPCDNFGRCFSTSMAILAMTPSYRQLPIYQRDESFEQSDSESSK